MLKSVWKTEKLNHSVQLTISGCLGPCDLANVALVITPDGNQQLGSLEGVATCATLVGSARACHWGNLMKRRDKFDYILIETTGMAVPGPVA